MTDSALLADVTKKLKDGLPGVTSETLAGFFAAFYSAYTPENWAKTVQQATPLGATPALVCKNMVGQLSVVMRVSDLVADMETCDEGFLGLISFDAFLELVRRRDAKKAAKLADLAS